jgi:hypothetical protein
MLLALATATARGLLVWRTTATPVAAQAPPFLRMTLVWSIVAESSWSRSWLLVLPTPIAGPALRLRAFGGAPTESTLAAESSAIPLTRGWLALDRASGRDAAAPVIGCRVARVALAMGAPLLLRSIYGPPMLPAGSGWRSPTRSWSVAPPSPRALGNGPAWPGTLLGVAWCVRWRRMPLRFRRRRSPASAYAGALMAVAFSRMPGGLCVESGSCAVQPLGSVALFRPRFRLPRLRLLPALAPLCLGSSLPCGGAH